MDKSWIQEDRRSPKYRLGVDNFLAFALENARDRNHICCPCTRCANDNHYTTKVIKLHLYKNGMDPDYVTWVEHGEGESQQSSEGKGSVSVGAESSGSVQGSLRAGPERETELDSDVELVNDEDEDVPEEEELNHFQKFVEDGSKPLYPGCDGHTKLDSLVTFYNLKAKHGMSNAAFSDWMIAIGVILPAGHELPASSYEAKKTLKTLGMDVERIHACPNDCILYRKEYKDKVKCPTCGLTRWKVAKNGHEREGIPAKVLWYLPPIPRFEKLFQSPETAKNLIWHATGLLKDGLMRHPKDAAIWKMVNLKYSDFGAEPRNLRLALSTDGFNPFYGLSSKYSCWPVIMVIYNLPPWLIMKRKHMMLTLLISGPKQPGNDIDVYLQPLIDDLKRLWEGVMGVYDAVRNEKFKLRALLLWTINDFPAYGNLSGNIVRGYNGCPICLDKTAPTRLKHGNKQAHISHRRWTRRDHPYRRQKAAFNGLVETRDAPVPLTGEEVLKRVEKEVPQWPYGKKYPRPTYKGSDDTARPVWKKRSIFFDLEYWQHLPVRHCLDVMHIEKNVCESLVGTLLNIPKKTKDGLETRKDLVEMGIRLGLAPNLDGPRKDRLPMASWNLMLEEKRCMCRSFFDMKVPVGYSSNISSLVSMETMTLSGLKSHDCHAIMQQLLPIAIRGVLEKPVRIAVIRLCLFFSEICNKAVDVARLPKIQADLVETLCLLEKFFPPSFFDVMIHLTVHLVREVELCGPVCFRWMYPFERYMKVCKGYVRNKHRPEGCIAENYIAEEAIEFLAELFSDDQKTVGIPSTANLEDHRLSGATIVNKLGDDLKQAHLHVLQNLDEFRCYFDEHMEYLKTMFPRFRNNVKWLLDKQNKEFGDWVQTKVASQLQDTTCNIPEIVRWVADKPNDLVPMFSGYSIGGVKYHTKQRDLKLTTQNSGVLLVAETTQVASARDKNPIRQNMSFYGVITEIWELDYDVFRFPVFKCDWVESARGVRVDDLGYTLVNLNKKGHFSDTFVLGKLVEQIFYVRDEANVGWSVVLKPPKRDHNDYLQNDALGDTVVAHEPITTTLPSIESFDNLTDDGDLSYMRDGDEDILIVEEH